MRYRHTDRRIMRSRNVLGSTSWCLFLGGAAFGIVLACMLVVAL